MYMYRYYNKLKTRAQCEFCSLRNKLLKGLLNEKIALMVPNTSLGPI